MAPAEQHQIVERGRAAAHPVQNMMGVAAARVAAREGAAVAVAGVESPPNRGRYGPSLRPASSTVPSVSSRITTTDASHASRRDVSATW